eukprot:1569043-Prorocentrum_lima.AAC.1
MTSSLVGSEMCIRDRRLGVTSEVNKNGCRRWQLRTQALAGSTAGHQPVSYTHLTLPTICSV